jgi:hypothetical protein
LTPQNRTQMKLPDVSNTNKLLLGLVLLIVILIGAIVILSKRLSDSTDDFKAYQQAMSNEFRTFTDKNGKEVAEAKAAVFATNSGMQDAVKQLNANGANILSKIDSRTQGLILLSKSLGGEIKGKTTVIGHDTVRSKEIAANGKDTSSLKSYPVYEIKDSTQWYSINGKVGVNGYVLHPQFADSTELKLTDINNGFFKPSYLGVQSLNKSPYAKTTGIKYLQVKKNPAKVWTLIKVVSILGAGFYLGTQIK